MHVHLRCTGGHPNESSKGFQIFHKKPSPQDKEGNGTVSYASAAPPGMCSIPGMGESQDDAFPPRISTVGGDQFQEPASSESEDTDEICLMYETTGT